MSSISEWLQSQSAEQERHHGVTPLEVAELPPVLRSVARLVLRETELSYPALCAAVAALPESDRLPQDVLDEALAALLGQHWLVQIEVGDRVVYKVNLRRKAGSAHRHSAWAALEEEG